MKYLVLRKRPEVPFSEMVSGAGGDTIEFPFEHSTKELTDEAVAELRRDPSVYVVPSMMFELIAPVEEPSGSPEAIGAWGIEAIGATQVGDLDGRGVKVAILDTGIDKKHAAFAGLDFGSHNLIDFTKDEEGIAGDAPDDNGHGTHVAGTIFGRDIGGTRLGVAPGVRDVLIGKVLGPKGGSTEAILNGIEWALRKRADVISMSLGMDYSGTAKKLVDEGFPADIAAARALEAFALNMRLFDRLASTVGAYVEKGRGALLVAATGNRSRRKVDPRYTVAAGLPAAADGFISVGALDHNLCVADFSNTGCVIAAPGVSILSAKLSSADENSGLITKSGTSMATPHVAGVIALWIQKLFPNSERPRGWAKEVQLMLKANAKPLPYPRKDVGRGLVQAPRQSSQ